MISKIVIIKESQSVNLDEMSIILGYMRIEETNIISIENDSNNESKDINIITSEKGSKVIYTEMTKEHFVRYLDHNNNNNFLAHNKQAMYILRNSNFLDIKNLFAIINDCQVNIGRGGSQRAHALSPLDLKLSCYLMAMFNFNHALLSYLNAFNDMSKDRYLSWQDTYNKSTYSNDK